MPLVALAGALSADSVRADCPRPRGAGSLCTVFEKPVERGQHQEWHQGYRPAPGAGTTYHGRFPTNGAYRHNGVSHRPAHHRAEEPPRWTHPAAPGRSRRSELAARSGLHESSVRRIFYDLARRFAALRQEAAASGV